MHESTVNIPTRIKAKWTWPHEILWNHKSLFFSLPKVDLHPCTHSKQASQICQTIHMPATREVSGNSAVQQCYLSATAPWSVTSSQHHHFSIDETDNWSVCCIWPLFTGHGVFVTGNHVNSCTGFLINFTPWTVHFHMQHLPPPPFTISFLHKPCNIFTCIHGWSWSLGSQLSLVNATASKTNGK